MSYPYPASQYPTAGVPVQPAHLRGRKPLWAALITFVIAVVLFVAGGIVVGTKSLGKVSDFQRVAVSSGGGTVTLNGTGKWIGYYEADDVSSSIGRIPGLRVTMTSPSGQDVMLQSYGNRTDGKVKKFTYDYRGHKGAAAFQFNVSESGTYQLRLEAVDPLPSDAKIAIGRDIVGGAVAGGVLIIGGVLFIVAAIALLIVGLVKRSRHKSELAASAYFGVYPPQPWAQQPPQPQPWQQPQPPQPWEQQQPWEDPQQWQRPQQPPPVQLQKPDSPDGPPPS